MTKYVKLIMVTQDNNNKFYSMTWDGKSSSFQVEYGRVESTAVTKSYPSHQWDTKYNEKVKKGYKDVTDLVSVTVTKDDGMAQLMKKIDDNSVDAFVTLMKKYRDNLVSKVYSVKATSVSQKQVDEAQKLLDGISLLDPKKSLSKVNQALIDLYMTIPRYMGNVKDHILPNIDLDKTIIQEQDNLDAMASQVGQIQKSSVKKATKAVGTILDAMGVTMKSLAKYPKELDYLIKQLTSSKIKGVFEVNRPTSDKAFETWIKIQKNTKTSILLHGTRCTSVLPILEQGLKIRPSGNYQFSGKAYGEGNYFSEVCQKSLGYTGYDDDQVLLVYEVHTGNPFKYDGWYKGNSFSLNYKELSKRGYDSTYVNAGNGLLNSEIIAYNEEQCRSRYIIHLKR